MWRYGSTPTGGGILYGVEPIVVSVVAVALWQLARTALKRHWFVVVGAMAVAGYLARCGHLPGDRKAHGRGRAVSDAAV
jgi:chromate transport protein ChrA